MCCAIRIWRTVSLPRGSGIPQRPAADPARCARCDSGRHRNRRHRPLLTHSENPGGLAARKDSQGRPRQRWTARAEYDFAARRLIDKRGRRGRFTTHEAAGLFGDTAYQRQFLQTDAVPGQAIPALPTTVSATTESAKIPRKWSRSPAYPTNSSRNSPRRTRSNCRSGGFASGSARRRLVCRDRGKHMGARVTEHGRRRENLIVQRAAPLPPCDSGQPEQPAPLRSAEPRNAPRFPRISTPPVRNIRS